MTRFGLKWIVPVMMLYLVGCDMAGDRAPELNLSDVLSQLDEPGESMVTSDQAVFVAQFEPRNIGQLVDGLHYGFLNPEETNEVQLGFMWGLITDLGAGLRTLSEEEIMAPSDCFLEKGAGLLAKKKFAKCVQSLHNHCSGAWSYNDEDGNTHADGYNMVQNDDGDLVLVDCDLPSDDGAAGGATRSRR